MILSVNIDHVATVRQARRGKDPDPALAVTLAELGGADGITVHLREDRRHINDRDVRIVRELSTIPLNLEMAATPEMIKIACEIKPDSVTLVPEKREELTTEGGLDVGSCKAHIRQAVKSLHDAGIPVSLFINPSITDVEISAETGTDMVEIHTGLYSDSHAGNRQRELVKVITAVQKALQAGVACNAGHGLNYQNVTSVAQIKEISGLYIGHSIVSRAIFTGLQSAVAEMKALILKAQSA